MATTDTRSGFRLPWSSDRSQEEPPVQGAEGDEPAAPPTPAIAWPESDFASRAGFPAASQRSADGSETVASEPVGAPESAPEAAPASSEPRPTNKKPSQLMADLAAAIRATTESARERRLSQLDAEAARIIGLIRTQSDEGSVALRHRSEADVAAIRDWAKAEIARIKEASEARISERKHLLEQEMADHAAAIEDRCAMVDSGVADYRAAMDAYSERLRAEDDPARLATLAETMPEPPALESFGDLGDLAVQGAAARRAASEAAEAEADAAGDGAAAAGEAEADATGEAIAAADPTAEPEAYVEADGGTGADGQTAPAADEITASEDRIASAIGAEPESGGDGVPRWAAGEVPEGFPEPVEGGDPVDRGAIMAALEAAAEAVVAAEAAAESAETAEAAADVAETAAEMLARRAGQPDEADPEAQAALSARMDAGGFDTESFQDRLASLLPGHADGGSDGEPRTTRVVVTGLVSVASIASFKRHLGRLAGVTAVSVASGPDGEFVFNVNHHPDVAFRDIVPTLPGFAARVVASGDGVVSVTARDPESEG